MAFILLTLSLQSHAQTTITGIVNDEEGTPLPGVNVLEKGTFNGAITDLEGNFSITVQGMNSTLVFSYVGYRNEEIIVGEQTHIELVMVEGATDLEEVVVVGYGTQKKETVTGSIASIGTTELIQSPQANISNSLVGRMPGLFAVQRSGVPGEDQSELRIRGSGTFTGSTSPLIMVDGIETQNYNNLDPNEIESVTILKDASATAVYGVRGANGVLLITTKSGSLGKPQVSFTSNLAISRFVDFRENMNSYQYAKAYNEALKYDSYITRGYSPKYSDEEIELFRTNADPIFYPDTDWVDLMIRPYAPQMQGNLNVTGGTEKVKYFISAGYFRQEGLFNNTNFVDDFDAQIKYNRYNLRSKLDFQVTKRMEISLNLGSQNERRSGQYTDVEYLVEMIQRAAPDMSPGIVDGKLVNVKSTFHGGNPMEFLINEGYNSNTNDNVYGSVKLKHELDFILDGLSVQGTINYQNYNGVHRSYSKNIVTYQPARLPNDSIIFVPYGVETPFGFGEWVNKNRNIYGEVGLNYEKSIGNHNITGLVLYNQSKLHDPGLAFLVPNGYQGLVGRATYDYKRRYLAEFNIGYNGTENFAVGKRFGLFPAYSVGWVVTEEPFFPDNNYISFLKIRYSYGEVGNDKIGGERFLYRPTSYTYVPNDLQYHGVYYFGEVGGTYQPYPISEEGTVGNPHLTWERARKNNLGIDMTLWKGQIRISADWFKENRDNILAFRGTIPDIIGTNFSPYNLGKMENSGFDGNISFNGRKGSFNYWINFNYGFARNVIEYMDEVKREYAYQQQTGLRVNQYFGLVSEGLYNTWDEVIDAYRPVSSYINNRIQPGDLKYKDINGDGRIDSYDQVPIGYSNFPEETFGLSFGGSFKGFDISVLFQGADNVSSRAGKRAIRGFQEDGAAVKYLLTDSWNHQGYEDGSSFSLPHIYSGSIAEHHNDRSSTFTIRNASYIRLKNVEIGYNFTNNTLGKIGIQSARIYLNGSNLYTWHNLLPGEDPEQPSIESEPYPVVMVTNFGINVKF